VKIYCPHCAALVGHLPGAAGADERYPRGCPFCNKHSTLDETKQAYKETAKRVGSNWVDDQGRPVKEIQA